MVCLLIWADLLTDLGWIFDRIGQIAYPSWLVLTDLDELVINFIKLLMIGVQLGSITYQFWLLLTDLNKILIVGFRDVETTEMTQPASF